MAIDVTRVAQTMPATWAWSLFRGRGTGGSLKAQAARRGTTSLAAHGSVLTLKMEVKAAGKTAWQFSESGRTASEGWGPITPLADRPGRYRLFVWQPTGHFAPLRNPAGEPSHRGRPHRAETDDGRRHEAPRGRRFIVRSCSRDGAGRVRRRSRLAIALGRPGRAGRRAARPECRKTPKFLGPKGVREN